MGSAANGMALHGGVIPYGATFFVFTDYQRPALRLGALMGAAGQVRLHARQHRPGRGRTHAPAHRAPGHAARYAQLHDHPPGGRQRDRRGAGRSRCSASDGPVALVLTRQKLPIIDRDEVRAGRRACARRLRARRRAPQRRARAHPDRHRQRGAAGAGSASSAWRGGRGGPRREHALPVELFVEQDEAYRDDGAARRTSARGWPSRRPRRSAGSDIVGESAATSIGLDRFGASAPAEQLFEHFGFTADNVYRRAMSLLGR